MKTKPEILEFIASKSLCVISTVTAAGSPQSAVVGFGQTDELELVIGTSQLSRKAQNIQNNSNVSVVIGWDGPFTLQYEGVIEQLGGEQAESLSALYLEKNPMARKFKEDPNQRYFIIRPTWLRYTDLTKSPWDISEFTF